MIRTLLLVSSLLLPAALAGQDALQRTASVAYDKSPLADVFKDLQAKTGVRVAFSQDLVQDAEAVTFVAQNTSVARILREITWPRGLELIRSDAELLALVPAGSDRGAAKQLGAALRTFVALEAKLEKAEARGDQVVIPGWSDDDEVTLMRAIFDLVSSLALADHPSSMKTWSDIEALARSPDPDVRAGSIVAVEQARALRWAPNREPLKAYARNLAQDSDEIAAATGLIALYMYGRDEDRALLTHCATDPRPVVRAAARIAAMCSSQTVPPAPNEASGAVRFLDYVGELSKLRRPYAPAFESMRSNIETEPNPVVQGMVLAMMAIMKADSREETLAPNGFVPLLPKANAWVGSLAARVDEAFAQDLKSVERVAALVTSERQSDQVVGLALAFGKAAFRKFPAKDTGGLFERLKPLLALQKSPRFILRAMGAAAAGLIPGAELQPFLDALQSKDPLQRLPAMGVLAAAPPAGKLDVVAFVRQALASPLYLEALAGSEIAGRTLSIDDQLNTFVAALQKSPTSLAARSMLPRFFYTKLSDEQSTKLVNALIESRADELLCMLASRSHGMPSFEKTCTDLFARSNPRVFVSISNQLEFRFSIDRKLAPGWLRRADELIQTEDASLRIGLSDAFARVISRLPIHNKPGDELRTLVHNLTEKILARSLKAADPIEAGGAL